MFSKHYPDAGIDPLLLTNKNETLLHLACYGTLKRILDNQDVLKQKIESIYYEEHCQQLEKECKEKEEIIIREAYPCLDFILELFKKNPDFMKRK